jgi:hypothetical protein
MENKRGQDVSPLPVVIGVILLLGVAVLLIVGLTQGWGALAFWIPQNNVQTVVTQCNVACTSSLQYDFCGNVRTLKVNSSTTYSGNCSYFAKDPNSQGLKAYGISDCPGITC